MPLSYKNAYTPPAAGPALDLHADTPVEEYDHNYVFGIKELRSERVELRPFIPSLHSQHLLQGHLDAPGMWDMLPMEFKVLDDVHTFVERTFRLNPNFCLFAIYSAPVGSGASSPTPVEEYEFAGALGIINTSVDDMAAEIGYIQILQPFQRTHVMTNAAGLLMHRILDPESEGGYGLRRCVWFANSLNAASRKSSLRLGFENEGILRNHRVLGPGKKGASGVYTSNKALLRKTDWKRVALTQPDGRKGDYKDGLMSRDTWVASITWQQWEERTKAHVDTLMARRQ